MWTRLRALLPKRLGQARHSGYHCVKRCVGLVFRASHRVEVRAGTQVAARCICRYGSLLGAWLL